MFTGLVTEMGTVKEIDTGSQSLQLVITAEQILHDLQVGDSIAVNGVCLTVTQFSAHDFHVDVMPETFHGTALRHLVRGSKVNLEAAVLATGRFGGHFVTGHVDGVGTIMGRRRVEKGLYLEISIPAALRPFLLEKGSIAIDGTSLTIFRIGTSSVTVSLIPHTEQATVLAQKGIGAAVNLEGDILAKYVYQLVRLQQEQGEREPLSLEFLQGNGFI